MQVIERLFQELNTKHQRKTVAICWLSMESDSFEIDNGKANSIGNAAIIIRQNVQRLQF